MVLSCIWAGRQDYTFAAVQVHCRGLRYKMATPVSCTALYRPNSDKSASSIEAEYATLPTALHLVHCRHINIHHILPFPGPEIAPRPS